MFLIYDTETTGLPIRNNAPIEDLENWPRIVQIAWQLHDKAGNILDVDNIIINCKSLTVRNPSPGGNVSVCSSY